MNNDISVTQVAASRAPITLMMILCGLVGAGAAGVASAAVATEAPTLVVHYKSDALATDSGARALYRRLEVAAEQVCPADRVGSHLVNSAILQCRQQAIARAVHDINNPRLAAVYSSNTKRG